MCDFLKPAMTLISLSLFLLVFVKTSTIELSPPFLPEAVQQLQLETNRGLKQMILDKEDENRNLEETIQRVEMEMVTVTQNNSLMKPFESKSISFWVQYGLE